MFDLEFERSGSSGPSTSGKSLRFTTSRDIDVILIESMPLAVRWLVNTGAGRFVVTDHCSGRQLVVRCSLTNTITIVGYVPCHIRDLEGR